MSKPLVLSVDNSHHNGQYTKKWKISSSPYWNPPHANARPQDHDYHAPHAHTHARHHGHCHHCPHHPHANARHPNFHARPHAPPHRANACHPNFQCLRR